MQFGVKHLVLDLAHVEHAAQKLGDFDRGGADKHGTAYCVETLDFGDDGGVFFLLCLIHAVVHVDTGDGAVCRDGHNLKLVDVPEFTGLRFGCTGHAGELVIHAEVVLESDGCESLCRSFHFHALLGLDSLVETVGIAAALHDAACLLIHNLDLVVVNHILDLTLEKGVGFQKLGNGVDAL